MQTCPLSALLCLWFDWYASLVFVQLLCSWSFQFSSLFFVQLLCTCSLQFSSLFFVQLLCSCSLQFSSLFFVQLLFSADFFICFCSSSVCLIQLLMIFSPTCLCLSAILKTTFSSFAFVHILWALQPMVRFFWFPFSLFVIFGGYRSKL